MIGNIARFIKMALPIVAFAITPGAAKAQSYVGSWPATVSHSQRANGTYCVTLEKDGEATLVPSEGTDFATYQVIDGLLIVTFTQPRGHG